MQGSNLQVHNTVFSKHLTLPMENFPYINVRVMEVESILTVWKTAALTIKLYSLKKILFFFRQGKIFFIKSIKTNYAFYTYIKYKNTLSDLNHNKFFYYSQNSLLLFSFIYIFCFVKRGFSSKRYTSGIHTTPNNFFYN